jgi:hypothetical protein
MAFFVVFSAWAFAAPYDAPADEVNHVIRAAGVVSGQIAPKPVVVKWGRNVDGMGAIQQVPRGLRHPATCWGFDRMKSAACQEPISGGPVEDVPTSAGRYPPTYYLMVGAPVRLWPGWGGLLVARLISAALSAALLAWAFMVLLRWSRFGLMLAALLASATPMLAHLAGAVNPNGLEITAGIALFAGGIPLLLGNGRGTTAPWAARAPLVWLVGLSAVLLVTLRSLGPLWAAAALAALLIPSRKAYLRELWQHRLVRGWTYAIAASFAFAVGWTVLMKSGDLVPPPPGTFNYTLGQAVIMEFNNWHIYLEGMVGVAGWFDIFIPVPFYWMYVSTAACMIIFALVVGSWSERWRFLVIFMGGVVVPSALQISQVNLTGFIIGGRYMLPLLVGMPLLAAFIVERQVLNARQVHSMTKFFCLLILPPHFILLVYAMVRWQRGLRGAPTPFQLNPLVGSWHPPGGSVLPLVTMAVGVAALAVIFWRAPRWAAAVPVPTAIGEAAAGTPDGPVSATRDEATPDGDGAEPASTADGGAVPDAPGSDGGAPVLQRTASGNESG